MASVTNFEISSTDDSIPENGTSQCASANESQAQNLKDVHQRSSKRYERTRSYDDAYYARYAKKHSYSGQQRPSRNTFQIYNPDQTPNMAPMYFGAVPAGVPHFDPYHRPYDAYYGGLFSHPNLAYLSSPPAAFDPPPYSNNRHYTDTLNRSYPVNVMKPGNLSIFPDQRKNHFDTMYRSAPLLNFGANSYFGWHQRPPQTQAAYRSSTAAVHQSADQLNRAASMGCLDGANASYIPNAQGQQTPLAACPPEMNSNTNGSILFDKEIISPFFKDPRNGKRQKGRKRCSPTSSFCAPSLGSSSNYTTSVRRNRIKLCIILSVLVIIVAVLVAMGIAVYSQALIDFIKHHNVASCGMICRFVAAGFMICNVLVPFPMKPEPADDFSEQMLRYNSVKGQNAVVKLVRQYQGTFVVTGGRQLDYDADLLNPQSQSFKSKSKEFERKIDTIFQESGLSSIYGGVEVTAFKFVVEPQGMEVQFNLKIKVNIQMQIFDLLAIIEDAIRRNVNGIFEDAVIDTKSLSIENQRLDATSPPPSTRP